MFDPIDEMVLYVWREFSLVAERILGEDGEASNAEADDFVPEIVVERMDREDPFPIAEPVVSAQADTMNDEATTSSVGTRPMSWE